MTNLDWYCVGVLSGTAICIVTFLVTLRMTKKKRAGTQK
jgi:hypothetical protein